MSLQHMQIGEVADRTGLSLRTIRYYEEVGLVTPSTRTSLEEMRRVLVVLDGLEVAGPDERDGLVEQLVGHRQAADRRVAVLREQVEVAEGFAQDLRREINRQRKMTRNPA